MPTYEYHCTVCENNFEVFKSVNDDTAEECPKCKVCTKNKVISTFTFTLKGDGWAKDGYSKK